MDVTLNPYLAFSDTARAAMEFYREIFGGELTVDAFGAYGGHADRAELVMHSVLRTPGGLTLMAGDAPTETTYEPPRGISVSLSGSAGEELRGYWRQLAGGGTVTVPLEKQVWGDEFGMCVDRFGVPWMVNISAPA